MIEIEIWSDIVCPFCYIGKRQLEAALRGFPHRDQVAIRWKSFQLDPSAEKGTGVGSAQHLAEKYEQSLERAQQMLDQMTERGKKVGLNFDFSRAIPTNSFDAHRLVHLAARQGLENEAEERLFSAYFAEGRDISAADTLEELGVAIGLKAADVRTMLSGEDFSAEVLSECDEAEELGIRGVPFFVLNRKYAVSGAQPVHVFEEALQKAWEDLSAGAHPTGPTQH